MKNYTLLITLSFLSATFSYAQAPKEKKTAKEVINEIPDMLIAQPDAGPDSNANKLINDNLSIEIPPLWREKGLHTLAEFKLTKTEKEPLDATFPPAKRTQDLVITMSTLKKSAEEKKQSILTAVKSHLTAYYKETETSLNAQELAAKANSMFSSPETFITNDGKQGEIYYINDIQSTQSNFIILLLIPSEKPGVSYFVQFNYTRYTYETTLPEDALELKTFEYPDDEKAYIDFTKKILRTFKVR